MQKLINTVQGLKTELEPLIQNEKMIGYLNRCIQIAEEYIAAERTPEEQMAWLKGKNEAYKYALKQING